MGDRIEFKINFQPIGKRVKVAGDTNLLEAAQSSGIALASLCGGIGSCDTCKVRLVSGRLTPPTLEEQETFSQFELEAGLRLACQARPISDVVIDIPPESLTTTQRLQLEGLGEAIEIEPTVRGIELGLTPPKLDDLRDDLSRIRDGLLAEGVSTRVKLEYGALVSISEVIRQNNWQVQVVLRGDRVVAILPVSASRLGLAVDVGTTKVATYLCELSSGKTLAKTGAMNPQISFGEDVISRIAYANNPVRRKILQTRLVETLNQMVEELCGLAAQDGYVVSPAQIVESVIVGNTAMHHLFANLPVSQLGTAPYVSAVNEALELRASDLGLGIAPGAVVYLPPNIAGYVGADHVSMLLATAAWKSERTVIALDIGTNTEISLVHKGKLTCCSCASGPAFEGAHIQAGMRAGAGAIERLQIYDGKIRLQTIGEQPPVGICGSGILDTISEMLDAGMLDKRGALQTDHPLIQMRENKPVFVLAKSSDTGHGREITVNRNDVNEIQLAKGAIRAGIETLLDEASIGDAQVDQIIVAGAFGTYINLASAIRVGMFPEIPISRFQQVGNAAGAGARQMLLSKKQRDQANEIAQRASYIELAANRNFTKTYSKALIFPE